jgi:crossover junction endodeoxyribonuclease RuvC
MIVLGIDPGLMRTGWGVISADGHRLSFVAADVVAPPPKAPLAERLLALADGLDKVITAFAPTDAAVEETFVNRNPTSTLRLGQARGVALVVIARAGVPVTEYMPNLVKKAIVGYGHADKDQVQWIVERLLPGARHLGSDAADALAVAICHAHHRQSDARIAGVPL